jgi:hypothetical protein
MLAHKSKLSKESATSTYQPNYTDKVVRQIFKSRWTMLTAGALLAPTGLISKEDLQLTFK